MEGNSVWLRKAAGMWVRTPQTCLAIRHIDHFTPKLPSILSSAALAFSSALGIELAITGGSGYSSVCTHKRNQPHYTEISLLGFLVASPL